MLNGDTIVYVTNTGSKYHSKHCGYLHSSIELDLITALKLYSPCSRCNPPTPIYNRASQDNSFSTRSSKIYFLFPLGLRSNPFLPNNSSIMSSNNQSIFSFNINNQQEVTESLSNRSDSISEEELKQLIEKNFKGILEGKIKELDRSLNTLQDKLDKDWIEQNRLNREKDEKLKYLSDELKMIKLQNLGLYGEVEDLKKRNITLNEKVENLQNRKMNVSIEKFELNFYGIKNFTNHKKLSDFVEEKPYKEIDENKDIKSVINYQEIEKIYFKNNFSHKKNKKQFKKKTEFSKEVHYIDINQNIIKTFSSIGYTLLSLIKNIPHSYDMKKKKSSLSNNKKLYKESETNSIIKNRKKKIYSEQTNPATIDFRNDIITDVDIIDYLQDFNIPFLKISDQAFEAIDIKLLVDHEFKYFKL